MNQYHVTCGISKKPIKILNNSSVKNLKDKIISSFNDIDKNTMVIQVFDDNWDDWLDIEDDHLPQNMAKLRVLMEQKKLEDDMQTQSSESSIVLSSDDMPDEETEACDVPSKKKWPSPFKVPTLPHDVECLLKQEDKTVLSRRYYRKIVQCLYENMVQYTLYPTTAQYTEVARALVTKFNILKDKAGNSTGHDTWRESLKNKFKHERAPLIHDEDVKKRKRIFGHSKKPAKEGDNGERTLKHVKRDLPKQSTSGEDECSINKHIADLIDLSLKRNPNKDIMNEKLERTKEYRLKFIAQNSVKDVLQKFPFLKLENQIVKEVERCYGSRDIYSSLRAILNTSSDKIIELGGKMKAGCELLDTYRGQIADCTEENEKKELTITVCCLLIPVLLGEDSDYLYCIDKDPVSPAPCLIIRGNVFRTKDFEVMVDGIGICKPCNVAMGIAVMFSCFYVYGIEYPKEAKNTLLYFQQYVAALGRDSQTPVKVQRFVNGIHIA